MVTEEFLLDFYRVNVIQSKSGPTELWLGFIGEIVDDNVSYGKATDTLASHPTWVEAAAPRVKITLEENFTGDTIRFSKEVEAYTPETLELYGYFLATSQDDTGLLLSVTVQATPIETIELGDSFSIDFGINVRATRYGLTREGATAWGRNYFYGTGGTNAQLYIGFRDAAGINAPQALSTDTLASKAWGEVGTRLVANFPEVNNETISVGPDFDFSFTDSHRAVNTISNAITYTGATVEGWFICDVASGTNGVLIWQSTGLSESGYDSIIMTPDSNAATLYPWLAFSSLSFID